MVAIVSGNGLGLDLGSWATLGGQGTWGAAVQGGSGEQVYVNAATGNLVVRRQDEYVAGAGLGMAAVRTYNSLGLYGDDNADNWSVGIYAQQMQLSGTVNTAGSSMLRIGRDGARATYLWDSSRGAYVAKDGAGAHDTIIFNTGTQQYERTDGSDRTLEKYVASSGRLSSVTDASGNTTSYTYDPTSGLLTKVVDGFGDTTWYDYVGTRLMALRTEYKDGSNTVSRTTVRYEYDAQGRLGEVVVDLTPDDNSVADGKLYRTTYTYDGSSTRIKTLTQTDGSSLTFGYVQVGADWRLASVVDALGGTTSYNYDTSARKTTVTDALGKVWTYVYDATGQLNSVTMPAVTGQVATQYFSYDADGNLIRLTNAESEYVTMVYDANGNQVLQRDHLGNTVTRTFSAANQVLTETRSNLPPADVVNQAGIDFVGSDIVKVAGTDGAWNAAFRSAEGFTGGASVSFKPAQTDKALMVGLNTDPGADHDWGSLDFALYCTAAGKLEVRESRSENRLGTVYSYAAGDSLQVDFDGTQVRYLKNGTVIYSHAATVTQPLYADSSFAGLGAKIGSLFFRDSPTATITPPLVVESKVTLSPGGTVVKNAGTMGAWDGSIRSLWGYTDGAMVSYKVTRTDKSFMVGLTTDPSVSDTYTSIDYAIYCESTGKLYAYENGTKVYFVDADHPTYYAAGDTLKVTYDGTKIKYLRGNDVLREVTVSITVPLYLDSSFFTVGSRIEALQFGRQGLTTVMGISKESAISLAGDSITKTGGGNAWDSSVRSTNSFTSSAHLSFSPGTTDKQMMLGLNSNPDASYEWRSLDWAFFLTQDGRLEIREKANINVNALSTSPTYVVGDRLEITYDGHTMRYLHNGVVLRSVDVVITTPLYMDSSLYGVGARVTDLRFGDDPSSDLTTRYVYAANNPTQLRFAISPDGRVTQYVYGSGAYGQRTTEVSYPSAMYGVSALAPGQVPTEADMTQWVAGLGDLSTVARRDFAYNAHGLVEYQKEYLGASSTGGGTSVRQTRYIYDASGRLLQRIEPGNEEGDEAGLPTTLYAYDGLGRVIATTDERNNVTQTTYDNAGRSVKIRRASGALTTTVYDTAGRLVSLVRDNYNATRYAYDAAGHLLMTSDPTGVRKFSLYDERGRRLADIDGDGTLTEYTYDRADRMIRQYTYKTTVANSLLYDEATAKPINPALTAIRPTSSSLDVQGWKVWDDAGRLVYDIGDQGAVTQYDYDGANRLIRSTQYAGAIVATTTPTVAYVQTQLGTASVLSAAQDNRVTRYFYDDDGHQVATLDAEGYLAKNTYDGVGRLVQTRRYASATAVSPRAAGAIELLTPADSADDQVEVYFYNGRDQLTGQVDAQGYLTKNYYNARGLLRDQTRYSTALANTPDWNNTVTAVLETIRPGGTRQASDRITYYRYTVDDQLLSTTNYEGTKTVLEYDTLGNLVQTTAADGLAEARSSLFRYDTWGRKTAELSAQNAARITDGMTAAEIDTVWSMYSVRYTYDQADRLTSRTDAKGNKTVFYYDKEGRLTHTLSALGEVEEVQYNALGQRTASIRYGTRIGTAGRGGGLVTSYLLADIAAVANADKDEIVLYGYNAAGQRETVTHDSGAIDTTTYNTFGELRSRAISPGVGQSSRVEAFGYDRRGMLISQSQGGGQSVVTRQLDAFGRISQLTDANGQVTATTYDTLGRALRTTDALAASRSATYDAFGQVLSTTDELGKVTKYVFDLAARKVTMTSPESVKVITVHDRHGQTYTVTDGNNVATTYTYDKEGRLLDTQIGATTTDSRRYDAVGLLVSQFDASNVETRYTYDAANRTLTRTVNPVNTPATGTELALKTSWAYDARGRTISMRDARSILTTYTFLPDGSVEQVVDAPEQGVTGSLALKTRWTYDDQGRVLSELSPAGTLTEYSYDALGRRSMERVDPQGLNLTTSYAYDKNGNLVARTDAALGITRYTYDADNRLVYSIDASGAVSNTQYDKASRVVRTVRYAKAISLSGLPLQATSQQVAALVQPAGNDQTQTQWYDKDGRLSYSVNGLGAVKNYTYDGNGNVTRRVDFAAPINMSTWTDIGVAPPVVSGSGDRVQRQSYDAFNRLTNSLNSLGGLTRFAYDAAGHIARKTEFSKAFSADVDPTTLATTAADLDPVNDRISAMYYDAAGRLSWTTDAMGSVTHNDYDANGNVYRVTAFAKAVAVGVNPSTVIDLGSADDRVTSMTYDRANRLRYAVDAQGYAQLNTYDSNGRVLNSTRYSAPATVSGSDSLSVSVSATPGSDLATQYIYDAAGRKLSETVAAGQVAARTTSYTYSALGLLTAEIDPRGTALIRDDTDWAKSERVRLGYPQLVTALTDTQKTAILDRFTSGHSYDAAGRRIRTTNALKQTTSTSYDALGNAVKVVDPRGNAGFFYFDALGRVTLQVDAEGYANEVAYANSFSQQITSVWRRYVKLAPSITETVRPSVTTNAKDARLQLNQYDKLDRLTRSEDSQGSFETISYGTAANRFSKSVTNKLGGTASYSYDRVGRQLQEILPVQSRNASQALVAVVNTYVYNSFGDRIRSIEAVGLPEQRTTDFRVDKMGRVTHRIGTAFSSLDATTLAASTVTPLEYTVYNGLGRVIEQRNAAKWSGSAAVGGMRTLSYYDAAGNKTAQLGPDGSMTQWTFDAAGQVYREMVYATRVSLPASPGGATPTATAVPAEDRITTSFYDALCRVTETRRDAVIHWEQPNNTNAIALNLPTTQPETITLGKTLYDANGNVVQQIDARGNSIYSYYDKIGRKLLQIDQDGYPVAWDYGDVFEVATKETRYSSRLPAYARQDDTSVTASLRDPVALRDGLDDGSMRPVDGSKGLRLNFNAGTNSAISRSLGNFSAGDTVTFTAWFKADLQTSGMIFIGEKSATGGWAANRYTTRYGDGDWQQLTAQITLTRNTEVVVYMYGDRDGAFHKAGAFVYYDRAQVESVQRGNVLDDSFESGTFEDWTSDGSMPMSEGLYNSANRVTEFGLDRQGRVLTESVQSVNFQYVRSDGVVVSRNTDAMTTYVYNGLGLTTQIRQRVSQDGDLVKTDVATDIKYDLMGREVQRQAPGYADQRGTYMRPTQALEYNGLGVITREIQRGDNDATETDDRITSYEYNANGQRITVTDALNQVTAYELDASGRIARRTLKGVADADKNLRDVVTLYRYDSAGRISMTTDVGTGEIRRTAYNAFGEISDKGLGDLTWQEFFRYTTLGKVQKTNAEGGAARIYLYDRNGNVTRQIEGGSTDLSNASVLGSATNTALQHTFSSYNRRNLLERTVEPDIKFQRDMLEMQGAFSQQLAPLYPESDLANSVGGMYTAGTVNASSYGYTQVGGLDAPQRLLASAAGMSGARTYGNIQSLGSTLADVNSFPLSWQGTGPASNQLAPSTKTFVVPANWPSGRYHLRNPANGQVVPGTSEVEPGGTLSVPVERAGASENHGYVVDYQIGTNGVWKPIATLHYERDTEPGVYGSMWWEEVTPSLLVASSGTPYASEAAGSAAEVALGVRAATDIAGQAIPGYWIVETSGLSTGTHSITVRCMDANGTLQKGSVLSITNGSSGSTVSGTPQVLANTHAWVSQGYRGLQRGMFFRPATLLGNGGGLLWTRPLAADGTSTADWSWRSVSGWGADVSGFAAGQRYEFIVSTGASEFHGEFTPDGNGVPILGGGGALQSVTRSNPVITFNLTDALSDKRTGSYVMVLNVGGTVYSKEFTGIDSNTRVSIDLVAEMGINLYPWTNGTYGYNYQVYSRHDPIRQLVGQGQGTLRLGSDPAYVGGSTSVGYRPQAVLTLPTNTSLVNAVTVRLKSNTSDSATLSTSDWRRVTLNSTQIGLDLSQWLTWGSGGPKRIEVVYAASDANFTAAYDLYNDGKVDFVSMTSDVRQPMIPLTIAGATRLSVLKVGGPGVGSATMSAVNIATRVTTNAATFTWNADDQPHDTARRFYYEAVEASGKLIGKGYGNFTMAQDNSLSYSMETPLLKPTVLSFKPPAGSTLFELQLRPQGSTGAYTLYSSGGTSPALKPDGFGGYTFDASGLVPVSGSAVFQSIYTAKNAQGQLQSSGRGTVTIQSTGASSSALTEDRKPTLVTFYSPPGRNIPRLRLEYRAASSAASVAYSSVVLTGTFDPALGRSVYVWDASAMTPASGTAKFDFVMRYQASDGSAYLNEMDDPIVIEGLMTLGATESDPVVLEQHLTVMNVDAQVRHMQVYNAFGQISEEYDDGTYERMLEMVSRYGNSLDPDAVRTTFSYNTMGLLTTKSDPQTHITASNGYQYRSRPVTRYGYDLAGRLTTVTDANNNLSKQAFAGGNDEHLALQWAGDGGLKRNDYDVLGELRQFTNEVGAVTRYTADLLGRRTRVERLGIARVENFTGAANDAGGAAAVAATLVDSYTYDALGQRISHTNAAGWIDKTYYDNLGRVITTVSTDGAVTSYTYAFKAAGASSGAILGAGGKNIGGWLLTTTQADGRTLQDATDYFGLTTWHQDLAGRAYTYTYDVNGRLTKQVSTGGPGGTQQNIVYEYFANGYLKQAKDLSTRMLSRYGYDNSGNRAWEFYSGLAADGVSASGVFQESTISYDELGRMSHIDDLAYELDYEYDAVGNRRAVQATYLDPLTLGLRRTDSLWYAYDAANRFTLTKGSLIGSRGTTLTDTQGRIDLGSDGVRLSYDQSGRRLSAQYAGTAQVESYGYSADGFLEDTRIGGVLRARRRVDALGRTLQYKEYSADGVWSNTTSSSYSKDNRLLSQGALSAAGSVNAANDGTTTYQYYTDATDNLASASAAGRGELAKSVFTPKASGSTTTTTTYTYLYWDSAKQATIKTQASNQAVSNWAPGLSSLGYDANGFLSTAVDTQGRRTITWFNNATGQTLRREEKRPVLQSNGSEVTTAFDHFWYYAAGRRVGEVSTDPLDSARRESYAESLALSTKQGKVDPKENRRRKPVTSADFDQNYQPINASYPAGTPDVYTVRSGDTLQSISLALWGDSAMWYLLAQSNNLSGSETLVSGQTLVVPNKVTNIHNNADTFRPYNPGEVIGHIDPTLPDPPKANGGGGCGGLGVIIMIVVAVAVTVVTAGAAAAAIAPTLGGAVSAGAAVLTGSVAATTALGVAGTMGLAAAGAAAGSVASQLVGKAIGAVDSFSWRAVAQSALGAGVGAGVGAALQGANVISSTGSFITEAGEATSWTRAAGAGLSQGLGSAATQAMQGKWSWRAVAATSVGAAAGSAAGSAMSGAMSTATESLTRFATGMASAVVGGWASSQVMATDPRYSTARLSTLFASGLGNALGSSVADSMQSTPDQSDAETARLKRYEAAATSTGGASGSWDLPISGPAGAMLLGGGGESSVAVQAGLMAGATQRVEVTGSKMSWWDKLTYDIGEFFSPDPNAFSNSDGSDWSTSLGGGFQFYQEQLPASASQAPMPYGQQMAHVGQVGVGFMKSLPNVPSTLVNGTIDLTKLSAGGYARGLNAAGLLSDRSLNTFLDSKPLHAPLVLGASNREQALGQVFGDFTFGAVAPFGLAKAVNYGVDLVSAARSSAGAAEGWAVGQAERAALTTMEREAWLPSTQIRNSQQSVSFAKFDERGELKYTLDDLARGFLTNPGDDRLVIDVVKMSDGGFTSVDHSRLSVLNVNGGAEMRVRLRGADDLLSASEMDRFTVYPKGSDPVVPLTWADAAELRIGQQSNTFANTYPFGMGGIPKITRAPADSIWSPYSELPWKR